MIYAFDYLSALFSGNPIGIRFQRGDYGVGRTFNGKIEDENHHQGTDYKVRLFAVGWFGVKRYLGSADTDADGKFTFECKTCIHGYNATKLVIQYVSRVKPFAILGVPGVYTETVVQQWNVQVSKGREISLEVLRVVPADQQNDLSVIPKPPTNYQPSFGYLFRLGLAVLPERLKKFIADIFFRNTPSAETTQKIYDSFGTKYRKQEPTPDTLLQLLCNEVGAVNYEREGNMVIWKCLWPDSYVPDEPNSLPNVIVRAEQKNEWLQLCNITVRFQGSLEEKNYDFTGLETDKNGQKHALYAAQSAFTILGEAIEHLAKGHLVPGVFQQAFITSVFPDNPLFQVVDPFLRDLAYINWRAANDTIFGQDSVIDATALEPKDVSDLIVRAIHEHSNWEEHPLPQEECCENHVRAKAYRYWVGHLKQFYLDYLNKNVEMIKEKWSQVRLWSASVQKRVSCPSFADEEPNLEKLATFLAWLAGMTTFGHWSVHSRQDMVTNLQEGSFRMQNEGLNEDGTHSKFGKTVPIYGSRQLFFARFLMRFKADTIRNNPRGDIPTEMHVHLCYGLDQLKTMGYPDADDMHLGTSI